MDVAETVKNILMIIPERCKDRLVLVGSVNLYLQGVVVFPKKDIDFATSYENVQELHDFFIDKTSRFCSDPNGDNYLPFSHLFVNVDGYEIEFFDSVNYGRSYYFGEIKDENTVTLSGYSIKCLNLETELAVYKKSGKEEKVRVIAEYLEHNKD